jgi:hypothetical protein
MQARTLLAGWDTVLGHVAAMGKRSVEITVRTGDHVEECTRIRVRGAGTVFGIGREPRDAAETRRGGDISCHSERFEAFERSAGSSPTRVADQEIAAILYVITLPPNTVLRSQ